MDAATIQDWIVSPEKVQRAIEKIIAIGRPRKIIVFGSFVKGTTTPDSDLDVLVITGDVREIHERKASVFVKRSVGFQCLWTSSSSRRKSGCN